MSGVSWQSSIARQRMVSRQGESMGVGAEAEIYRLRGRKQQKVPRGSSLSDLLQVDWGAVYDISMHAYGLLHMLHSTSLLKILQAMGQSSASSCSKQTSKQQKQQSSNKEHIACQKRTRATCNLAPCSLKAVCTSSCSSMAASAS